MVCPSCTFRPRSGLYLPERGDSDTHATDEKFERRDKSQGLMQGVRHRCCGKHRLLPEIKGLGYKMFRTMCSGPYRPLTACLFGCKPIPSNTFFGRLGRKRAFFCVAWSRLLCGCRLNLAAQFAEDKLLQFYLVGAVVDVNTNRAYR